MSLVCAGGFAAFGVAALVLRFVRRTRKRTITWDDAIKRAREHALQDGEEYGICPLTGKKRTSFYVNPLDVWEPSELERALTRVEVVKPVVEVEGIGMDADVGMDGPEMIETTFASVGRDIQPGTCSKDLIVTEETEMRIDTPEDWDSDSKPLILAQVTEITPPIAKTESSSIDCDGAAAQFSEPLPIWVQSQPQSSTFICPHPSCFKEFSKQFELKYVFLPHHYLLSHSHPIPIPIPIPSPSLSPFAN